MNKKQIKKVILEATFFGVVIFISTALLAKLTPLYRPSSIHATNNVELAMIRVPVPIHSDMEGKKVQFVINCTMKRGLLECVEGN